MNHMHLVCLPWLEWGGVHGAGPSVKSPVPQLSRWEMVLGEQQTEGGGQKLLQEKQFPRDIMRGVWILGPKYWK